MKIFCNRFQITPFDYRSAFIFMSRGLTVIYLQYNRRVTEHIDRIIESLHNELIEL